MSPTDSAYTQLPAEAASRRQQQLVRLLVCPICRSRVGLVDATRIEGAAVKADLHCQTCGIVGLINAYRPSFFQRDRDDANRAPGLIPEWVSISLDLLAFKGSWRRVPEGLLAADQGAQLGGLVKGSGIRFELLTHRWSGRVRIEFDGQTRDVDLATDSIGRHVEVLLASDDGEHAWSLTLLDGGSAGTEQVVLHEIFQYVIPANAQPLEYVVENYGNPYPARFDELLTEFPEDAAVLDLGGGDRRHPDPRVLNLEYLPYRRVDLYADGLQLPFADNSFDLIMSQAVLEHVPDPFKAVSEMKRILKPGGRLYAEFAFMQPLHAVPFHFFNITPHGATLLFQDWDEVQIGSFGGLGETMQWFFRLVDAEGKIGIDRASTVVEHLSALDRLMSACELEMLSSAVYVEATSPAI